MLATKQIKRVSFFLLLLLLLLGVDYLREQFGQRDGTTGNTAIEQAWKNQSSDIWVSGSGRVVKLLADDTKPPRHQKFIVAINDNFTILVSHNIDLAPRISSIAVGKPIEFKGEYIWNNKGGLIHWTHHDPQNRHSGGWLKYGGETYR